MRRLKPLSASPMRLSIAPRMRGGTAWRWPPLKTLRRRFPDTSRKLSAQCPTTSLWTCQLSSHRSTRVQGIPSKGSYDHSCCQRSYSFGKALARVEGASCCPRHKPWMRNKPKRIRGHVGPVSGLLFDQRVPESSSVLRERSRMSSRAALTLFPANLLPQDCPAAVVNHDARFAGLQARLAAA